MKKKRIITLVSLAVVFSLLLTIALLGKFAWGWFDDKDDEDDTRPTLLEGEAYFGNMKDVILMYPQIQDRSEIFRVRVHNTKGENYFFLNTQTASDMYFLLGECDDLGNFDNEDIHRPPIADALSGFSYSSLYDNASKMAEIVAAVSTVNIAERIFPEEGTDMKTFLAKYGLTETEDYSPAFFEVIPYARDAVTGDYLYTPLTEDENSEHAGAIVRRWEDGKYYYVELNPDYDEEDPESMPYLRGEEYTDGMSTLIPAANEKGTIRVRVGKRTVDDNGYYLYYEGRDVVYTSSNPYIEGFVEHGLGYYIAPRLVTEAVEDRHILTPGFTMSDGKYTEKPGTPITSLMTVGMKAAVVDYQESNGGSSLPSKKDVSFMVDMTNPGAYEAFAAVLSGKVIGDFVDVLIPTNALVKPGDGIPYTISRIRGILKGTKYLENTGDVLTGNERIIVAYTDNTLSPLGGYQTFYGYIDLATAPEKLRNKLIGCKVSEDTYNITYDKVYDGLDNDLFIYTYDITSISVKDASGAECDTVDYGTTVTFGYHLYEDGVYASQMTATLKIPAAGDGDGQYNNDLTWYHMAGGKGDGPFSQNIDKLAYIYRNLADALLGKKAGSIPEDDPAAQLKVDIRFIVEDIFDYELYRDTEVKYCMENTEILSFAFENEVDLLYSSSLYRIEGSSQKSLYSLDQTASEKVISLFANLTGDETVAVGIDNETMAKYGLYAYHIHFVMPFNATPREVEGKTYWYTSNEVPFDLYISETQPDGSRYIGSTQYDTVVRITDGSSFDFLEWSFTAKWMQNSLVLLSYQYMRRMIFDLNFSEEDGVDFNSVWGFDLTVDPYYAYPSSSEEGDVMPRLYAAIVKLGKHAGIRSYDALNNMMTYKVTNYDPSKESRDTIAGALAQVITEGVATYTQLNTPGWRDLDDVYGNVLTNNGVDMTGSDNYNTLLQILNAMRYSGESAEDLSPEEIASLTSGEYTMRVAISLLDQRKANAKEHGYTLTFYNYGVNSLVVVTNEDLLNDGDPETEGIASLFYVRSREVVKLAQAVVDLNYGRILDTNKF